MLNEIYSGRKYTLIHCDGALDSLRELLEKHCPQAKAKKTMVNKLLHQINRLIDGHPMSDENFPQEGVLPGNNGHFNAIKKIPIRGYLWKSTKNIDTYFISHFVQELSKVKGSGYQASLRELEKN